MLRVRVEVVPYGRDDAAFVVDEVWAENDGTGRGEGAHEGGVGNYNILKPPPEVAVGEASAVQASMMGENLGRVEKLPRDAHHRIDLAKRALYLLQIHNEADAVTSVDGRRSRA